MTAHVYWDRMWRTQEGRSQWLEPHPWVERTVLDLYRSGARDALDLGCGVGRHAVFMAGAGMAVHGTDLSPAAIDFARSQAGSRGVQASFHVADAGELPFPTDSFDLVLAFNVVYHADEAGLGRCLAEVLRVLRPGGVYMATMLSKRNHGYGLGLEVSPNTFVQLEAEDDKVHPHLYVDAEDLVRLHRGFQLVSVHDAEHSAPGSYHWHCVFDAGSTAGPRGEGVS